MSPAGLRVVSAILGYAAEALQSAQQDVANMATIRASQLDETSR